MIKMSSEEVVETSTGSKVCSNQCAAIDTVILLAKAGHSQASPDLEYAKEIDNLSNVTTYFISPIQFQFVNMDHLTHCMSTPSDWSGIILTSIRCVDALVLCLEHISNRDALLVEWSKLQTFTVGEATKAYLFDKLQLDSTGHHSSNAAALANYILQCNSSHRIVKPLIYPCSSIRSDFILDMLHDRVLVKEITCYEIIASQQLGQDMAQLQGFLANLLPRPTDPSHQLKLVVVFFSPSGVDNLLPHLRDALLVDSNLANRLIVKFVAFGKVTAEKMAFYGLDVWFVASAPKPKSLAIDLSIHLHNDDIISQ